MEGLSDFINFSLKNTESRLAFHILFSLRSCSVAMADRFSILFFKMTFCVIMGPNYRSDWTSCNSHAATEFDHIFCIYVLEAVFAMQLLSCSFHH